MTNAPKGMQSNKRPYLTFQTGHAAFLHHIQSLREFLITGQIDEIRVLVLVLHFGALYSCKLLNLLLQFRKAADAHSVRSVPNLDLNRH